MKRGQGEGGKGEAKEKAKPARGGGQEPESIDSLYQLPLSEFTPARNALATRLKKAGRTDEADEVRSLVKPSVSAWAANQVFWRHRVTFDRLISAGDRLRNAQSAGKSGDVRGALDDVRETLSELTRLAAEALLAVGNSPTAGVMRAVTATLEALSAYGSLPHAPRAGRLVDEVDPPGFETLAALVPHGRSPRDADAPSRVLRFQQSTRPAKLSSRRAPSEKDEKRREEERQARLAAAKAAAHEAERGLREARTAAQQAQAALKKAAAEAKDTETAMIEAEQLLEKTAKEAHTARQLARRLAVEAEAAAQAVEEAEQVVEKVKKEVEELKG
jgi:DNA repair exonuclease SbcCD ATPase subunit